MSLAATIVVVVAILIGALIVKRGLITMSDALERLTREVAESRAVQSSAITLIQGLTARIRAEAENPSADALNALADDLDLQQAALAHALTEGTPVAPIAEDEQPAEGGGDQQEE
jgi:hypothetical protein